MKLIQTQATKKLCQPTEVTKTLDGGSLSVRTKKMDAITLLPASSTRSYTGGIGNDPLRNFISL